ncbi:hypothetical protein SPFM7_00007 [Salmonella phage SPFM7]|nr:hypothetical protein SPFM7_00007 [Salmonella phage SPFM7]
MRLGQIICSFGVLLIGGLGLRHTIEVIRIHAQSHDVCTEVMTQLYYAIVLVMWICLYF